MQKPDLSEPQKFNMADIVIKNSKTGLSQHERLLVIKRGHLYYYSDIPKNFNNNVQFLQTYHELPKCSIQILNIKKINGFQDNTKYFSIEFEARYMMEKEDIRKTMTLQEFNFAPKNKKQTITWQFTCKNQYIKQKWVHTLQMLHYYYNKQKINIQKFFDTINKKQETRQQNLQPAIRSSMKVPWREDQLKMSGSNESLRKSHLNGNTLFNRSPSNTKKSISSEQKSPLKQKQKQINKNNNQSQPEEDLVESFMKIQKTRSVYEPHHIIDEKIEHAQAPLKQSPNIKNLNNNPINNLLAAQKQQPHTSLLNPNATNIITQNEQQNNKKTNQLQRQRKKTMVIQYQIQPEAEINQNVFILPQVQMPAKNDNITQISKTSINIEIPKKVENINKTFKILKKKSFQKQKQFTRISLLNKKISLQQKIISLSTINPIEYKVDFNTNFYQLLYFSCNKEYSFQKRIDAQKKINLIIGNFTDKCCKSFIEFVNMKGQQQQSRRYAEQKISDGVSHLEIGYCRYKIGYVTTQAISINDKPRIYYNQVNVKSIKRQMTVYNKLLSLIAQNIKNLQNSKLISPELSLSLSLSRSQTKNNQQLNQSSQLKPDQLPINLKVSLAQLRVPLCTYIQYKGLCAMVYDETYKNMQNQLTNKQKLKEWKQLMRMLGFNNNYFQFKTIKTSIGQLVIAYITNAATDIFLNQKQNKHHNVGFQSPLNIDFLKKAKKQKASTSIQSLLRYIKVLSNIQDTSKFICPLQQIITTLQYCYLCKYLRKFYRAAQAQLDELKFINLLLKGDTNINKLFQTAGFQFQSIKRDSIVIGIFFQFLLYYLGINCEVDINKCQQFAMLAPIGVGFKDKTKRQSVNCVKSVKLIPRVIGYNLDGFQLYESFSKIEFYISNNSKQLAEKAIQYKQSVYFQNSYQLSSYPWPASAICLYSLAQLSYLQNDYITSIAKSKQFLFTVSPGYDQDEGKWQLPAPSCCIPIYFIMIKCYSKFSREKFNESLKQLIQSTIFNFGQNSSMIVTLFSFTGLIFYGIGEYAQAERFLISAIKISQKLYQKYQKSKLIQLYLDLSRVLTHQNKTSQALTYYSEAERLKGKQSNYQQTLNFTLYSLESVLKAPKTIQTEQKAMQVLFNTQKFIKKSQTSLSNLKQYYKLVYQISIRYNKSQIYEKVIEQLWKMENSSKFLAVEYAYRLIKDKFEGIINEKTQILDEWSLSKQKSILKIQQNLVDYKTLLQMMNDVFTEEDSELIPAFLKLLPLEVIRTH